MANKYNGNLEKMKLYFIYNRLHPDLEEIAEDYYKVFKEKISPSDIKSIMKENGSSLRMKKFRDKIKNTKKQILAYLLLNEENWEEISSKLADTIENLKKIWESDKNFCHIYDSFKPYAPLGQDDIDEILKKAPTMNTSVLKKFQKEN